MAINAYGKLTAGLIKTIGLKKMRGKKFPRYKILVN